MLVILQPLHFLQVEPFCIKHCQKQKVREKQPSRWQELQTPKDNNLYQNTVHHLELFEIQSRLGLRLLYYFVLLVLSAINSSNNFEERIQLANHIQDKLTLIIGIKTTLFRDSS